MEKNVYFDDNNGEWETNQKDHKKITTSVVAPLL